MIRGGPEKREFNAWGIVNSLYFYRKMKWWIATKYFHGYCIELYLQRRCSFVYNSHYLSGTFINNWKQIWIPRSIMAKKDVYLQKHLWMLWKKHYEHYEKNICLESRSAPAPGCKACGSLECSKSTAKLSNGAASLVLLSLLGIWCQQKMCSHHCASDKGHVTNGEELVQW